MNTDTVKNIFRKYVVEIIVFLGAFLVAFLLIHFTSIKFINDDQFIFYRYVDNIFQGNGFVYNVGEHVLGSTAPLFTIIVAFFKWIFSSADVPVLTRWINIFLFSFASVFFYRVATRVVSKKFAIFSACVFIFSLAMVIPEAMETSLFILTVFLFLDTLLSKRFKLSAVFLALAILTRPDAGLIGVLAFIYWYIQTNFKRAVGYAALCFGVLLPWLVFATVYFGSFVPQSLIAKGHMSAEVIEPPIQAFKFILAHVSMLYWGQIYNPDAQVLQIIFNLLPVLILAGLAIWKKTGSKKQKDVWILFAIPFIYLIGYGLFNPVMFAWYGSQMLPFWMLVSLMGAEWLFEKIGDMLHEQSYRLIYQTLFLLVLIVGPIYGWYKTTTSSGVTSKQALYVAADYLNSHMKTGDTVGLSNIGIVGYYTHAHIIDFVGLVTTSTPAYYPIMDGCRGTTLYVVPPKLIEDTKPNWIVAGGDELETCFRTSMWFTSHYSAAYDLGAGGAVWKRTTL